ncbi:putative rho GDP-dissociation inhibitor 1 [Sesbania bispinosa]|nr:putative rho GDP-dissociation inhibitor 1 [Sesbania bispinosa]
MVTWMAMREELGTKGGEIELISRMRSDYSSSLSMRERSSCENREGEQPQNTLFHPLSSQCHSNEMKPSLRQHVGSKITDDEAVHHLCWEISLTAREEWSMRSFY